MIRRTKITRADVKTGNAMTVEFKVTEKRTQRSDKLQNEKNN